MDTVIIVNRATLGEGDDKLGEQLMRKYLFTLSTTEPRADVMVFYNTAVSLLADDSPCLGPLQALEEQGVDLLACVTCLEHLDLLKRLAVGTVSSMREIVGVLQKARKVITM